MLFTLALLFVRGVLTTSGQECSNVDMERCTDPLKLLTDNKDLGFAVTRHELSQTCPKLIDGLRCIDNFTLRCLEPKHRAYFNTLYSGTSQVILDLCQDGPYQTEYLRHAPCMRTIQTGYENCAAEYQDKLQEINKSRQTRIEGSSKSAEDVRTLCCSFQSYLYCSQSLVTLSCGDDTGEFTREFLDRMAGSLIQGHCLAYEHGSAECYSMSSSVYCDPNDKDCNDAVTSSASVFLVCSCVFLLLKTVL